MVERFFDVEKVPRSNRGVPTMKKGYKDQIPAVEIQRQSGSISRLEDDNKISKAENVLILDLCDRAERGELDIISVKDKALGLEFIEIQDPQTKELLYTEERDLWEQRMRDLERDSIIALGYKGSKDN